MAGSPNKLIKAKVREFSLVQGPFKGYRAREDITMLPPGILVKGSQNVLTNTSQRIAKRKGYKVDGQTNITLDYIHSSFDWTKILNNDTHVRSWSDKLQYRFVASDGTVTWNDVATGFSSVNFNYTTMFDTAELFSVMLFVNGTSNIYEWGGGVTTFASDTSNTITKQGTTSWIEDGFYSRGNITATTIAFASGTPGTITDSANGFTAAGFRAGQTVKITGTLTNNITTVINSVTDGVMTTNASLNTESAGSSFIITAVRQVSINGTVYTYTGGESTTTLTGVTPNPTGQTIAVGNLIIQTIRTVANTETLGLPGGFKNDLIGNLTEQVYVGSLSSYYVYISKLSNYADYAFSNPRQPGEGAKKTLTGYARAFIVQDTDMYISAGADSWYQTQYVQTTNTSTVGSDQVSIIYEQINFLQLKTTPLQAAKAQAAVSKIDNNIVFLSNEPVITTLGPVTNVYQTPQMTDISFPIVNDMNKYDFTDASILFFRKFVYIAVPKEEIILVYNRTNPENPYWEAPQTIPISRFAIINDKLYGHGYLVPETYELFVGYRDRFSGDLGTNGSEIPMEARFSFQNSGVRAYKKDMNAYYVEGYISPNSTLTIGIQYDIDGCAIDTNYDLDGGDTKFVCIPTNDNSLGKFPLGKQPLGLDLNEEDADALPPKFRVIKTFPRTPYYEFQPYFQCVGIDEQVEIVAFGGNEAPATQGPVAITD